MLDVGSLAGRCVASIASDGFIRGVGMKRIALLFVMVLSAATFLQAQGHWSFKGTVIKMRMTDCAMQRGFMATMSGASAPAGVMCPEFTVVSDKVVYVVVGRRAEEFIPLAEDMEFPDPQERARHLFRRREDKDALCNSADDPARGLGSRGGAQGTSSENAGSQRRLRSA